MRFAESRCDHLDVRQNPFPARGRKPPPMQKTASKRIIVRFDRTLSPQGDGNPSSSRFICPWNSSTEPFPRKGTETWSTTPRRTRRSTAVRQNPFPARGRKPVASVDVCGESWCRSTEPFPRKGTETRKAGTHRSRRTQRSTEPFPRKGTETGNPLLFREGSSQVRQNPFPARGRKRHLPGLVGAALLGSTEPFPRKGTETNADCPTAIARPEKKWFDRTLSPQGDGNWVLRHLRKAGGCAFVRQNPFPARGRKLKRCP